MVSAETLLKIERVFQIHLRFVWAIKSPIVIILRLFLLAKLHTFALEMTENAKIKIIIVLMFLHNFLQRPVLVRFDLL